MPEYERTIAFGDIHGCALQLYEVLDQIKPTENDLLIFLGDYIDRGPESDAVVQTLQDLDAIFLKGNHEVMFLNRWHSYSLQMQEGLQETSGLSVHSITWLGRHLELFHETDTHLFVHAGFDKERPLHKQSERECCWVRRFDDYSDWTDKVVVHGHTVTESPEIIGNRLNINTGCGSGGYLTAFCIEEDRFYKSSLSPGIEFDWETIRIELEQELKEYEEMGELEEIE